MTNYIRIFSVFCTPATDPCLRFTEMQIKIKLAATITCLPLLEKQPYVIDWKWQVGIPEKNLDLVWVAHTSADISGDVQAEHTDRVGCSRWGRAQCAFIWYILTIQISALHLLCDRRNYILASPEVKCYALTICVLSRKITKACCLNSFKCISQLKTAQSSYGFGLWWYCIFLLVGQ